MVADGGQIILYAPHVASSRTPTGRRSPGSATTAGTTSPASGPASSTSRGGYWPTPRTSAAPAAGSAEDGERCRTTVTLATGIDEATVRAVGLDWRDPAEVDPAKLAERPGTLVIPNAGEVLYRLAG